MNDKTSSKFLKMGGGWSSSFFSVLFLPFYWITGGGGGGGVALALFTALFILDFRFSSFSCSYFSNSSSNSIL